MEASSAGLASAGDAGGDGGEGAGVLESNGGNGHNGGGQDFGQLMDTLQQLSQGQEEMRGWLSEHRGGSPEVGALGGDAESFDDGGWELDAADGDGLGGEGGEAPEEGFGGESPEELDPEADAKEFADALSAGVHGMIGEAVGPRMDALQRQLSDTQREMQVNELVGEFPELGEEGVANEVVGAAYQYAQALGWPAEVANSPQLWRLTYLAGRALEAAAEEGEADEGAARLEGSGSAGSGQQSKSLLEQMNDRDGGLGKDVLKFG